MTTPNERNCSYCGKLYSLIYTNKNGYNYKVDTVCCSKICAAKFNVSLGKGAVMPDPGAVALKEKAINFLKERGCYSSMGEICNAVGHSNKTFVKHGLKTTELNSEAGFKKPKSKFQESVESILRQKYTDVETEKSFKGLVGNTGFPLRVDFYLPEINTVVEADGSQHRDPNHQWHKFKNGTVEEYDKIKEVFFKENNVKVVRIPYKINIKNEDVLFRLE